jgi:alkylation response protein AidB-like acyl-CoA dehydrogenase
VTVGLFASLSDEQALLVQSSIRFMESEHSMSVVRDCADGGDYDAKKYGRAAAKMGWLGFLADESHGGGSLSDNGLVDAALVAAERGARLQPAPLVGHSVVVHALSRTGAGDGSAVLTELIEGAAWATWGCGQAGHCSIRGNGDAWRLAGHLAPAADVDACRWLLLTADGPGGLTQLLVPTDQPGFTVRRLDGLDVARRWFAVSLDDVLVDAGNVVGKPGSATEALVERQVHIAAVLTAAETVGAMHADLEQAVAYAQDRTAFGRPIGSFQAIKHLLADCSLWLEMSKGIVSAAAAAVGSGVPHGPELAHAAKSFVSERSMDVAHGCFQVYGGIGFTWDHDQHLYFRRIASNAALFGSAAWHRRELLASVGLESP